MPLPQPHCASVYLGCLPVNLLGFAKGRTSDIFPLKFTQGSLYFLTNTDSQVITSYIPQTSLSRVFGVAGILMQLHVCCGKKPSPCQIFFLTVYTSFAQIEWTMLPVYWRAHHHKTVQESSPPQHHAAKKWNPRDPEAHLWPRRSPISCSCLLQLLTVRDLKTSFWFSEPSVCPESVPGSEKKKLVWMPCGLTPQICGILQYKHCRQDLSQTFLFF